MLNENELKIDVVAPQMDVPNQQHFDTWQWKKWQVEQYPEVTKQTIKEDYFV